MGFLIGLGLMAVVIFVIVICVAVSQAKNIDNTDKLLKEHGFTTTRAADAIRVDDKNKKWCINNGQSRPIIYDFAEVLDSKIEENSVLNKVNKLGVYIYTKNGGAIYIPLINSETKRDGFVYSSSIASANQMHSLIQSVISHASEKSLDIAELTSDSVDIEEQLKKFKGMADSGLITQEDFEAKKKQLLGL